MDSVEIGEGGVKQQKINEVYATDGGTSIVVMEDDPDRDDRPIPSRVFKQAKMPRNSSGHGNNDDEGPRRNLVTKDVLPDDAVVQFADLDGLANPDKVSKPEAPKQEGPAEVFDNDGPVPARFPPPPPPASHKSKTKSRAKRPETTVSVNTTLRKNTVAPPTERDAPPLVLPRKSESTARKSESTSRKSVSTTRKSSQAPRQQQEFSSQYQEDDQRKSRRNQGAWDSDYEVERDRHVEFYEMNPSSPPRRYFSEDVREHRSGRDERGRGETGREETRSRRRSNDRNKRRDEEEEEDLPFLRNDNHNMDDEDAPRRKNRAEVNESSRPQQPKISPEMLQKRREEDEKKEKMQLLHRLFKYEQRGYHLTNAYSMESNIDELRFEVSKIRNEESARHSVKWYKVFLMILVSSVETLNTKFDPFGLRLKGWSRDMNSKKEDLDDCFHRLHDKYSSKAAIEPELELMFAFFGGAFMYHLENAAESFGTIGNNIVKAITGGAGGEGQANKGSSSSSRTSGNVAPKGMMTNMHSLQPNSGQTNVVGQQERPQPARPARRVMKAPSIPSGAMDMANIMMTAAEDQDDMDVPIPTDFEMPPSVGGNTTVGRASTTVVTGDRLTSNTPPVKTPPSRVNRQETGQKSASKPRGNRPPTTPSKTRSVAL